MRRSCHHRNAAVFLAFLGGGKVDSLPDGNIAGADGNVTGTLCAENRRLRWPFPLI